MNGEITTAVSLALHGRAWLTAHDEAIPAALTDACSTVEFIGRLTFSLPATGGGTATDGDGVGAWLRTLRGMGASGLWLGLPTYHVGSAPAHVAVASAGGHSVRLLATGPHPSWWQPVWRVTTPSPPDGPLWDVHLHGQLAEKGATPAQPELAWARDGLVARLTDAERFAAAQDQRSWAELFGRAREAADDATAASAPADRHQWATTTTPEAVRLLDCASRSWVFGGMGSWNDVGVDSDAWADYEEVTARLYEAVLTAVLAATNAPLPPP